MPRAVPVLRENHDVESVHQGVAHGHHLVSPGNFQCPARDEIVLDVDDQQGIAGNGLESRVESCGGSSTLARLDSALRECEHLVDVRGAPRSDERLMRGEIWG